MIVRTLLATALCMRLAAPVVATPPIFGRQDHCITITTTTVTVTSMLSGGPSSVSGPEDAAQTAGIISGSQATSLASLGGGGSLSTDLNAGSQNPATQGPQTSPVVDNVAFISTLAPSQGPGGNPEQQTFMTASPAQTTAGGQPSDLIGVARHTVTVTVTSIQTETVTQIQTFTQLVYQTLFTGAPAAASSEPTTILTQTVTSTTTYIDVISASHVGPGLVGNSQPALSSGTNFPLLPSNRPFFQNGTQGGNSSTSPFPAPSHISSATLYASSSTPLATPVASSSSPVLDTSEDSSSVSYSSSGYENGVYFANWAIYGAQYQPQSLPASSVTRIHYAFADIGSDGTVKSSDSWADVEKRYSTDSWNDNGTNAYGCVKQLYLLKAKNRSLKVLLSVGGWTWSYKFSSMAADATMRQTFASSAVKLITDWGFDGIDIDWEFNAYDATKADAQNIILLLQAVRNAFTAWSAAHAPGYHFLVTVASPAGPAVYGQWDMAAMDPYIDSWNLMAYDYAGAWGTAAGHAANLYFDAQNMAATPYSTDQAVSAYVASGVAPSKIIMGLPLYGRSFEETAGLGAAYDGVGPGDSLGAGQWRLKDLPRPGATEFYDDVAKMSYSYDASTRELISYDNLASATEKGVYLKNKGLGGAMFWEASDDKNGTDSLVVSMAGQLGILDRAQNLLNYPTSQYDNIREGMPGS